MSKFFAYLDRMKYIERWGLMRSVRAENVAEHSHNVAVIAYALAVIDNEIFSENTNADRTAVLAVFHEAGEVITGDLPTPVKYFNKDINTAYKAIEKVAEDKLISMLPEELEERFRRDIQPDKTSREYAVVKAADKIAAYVKCVEEERAGNTEFESAKKTLLAEVRATGLKCAEYFMEKFVEAFEMTLDELL